MEKYAQKLKGELGERYSPKFDAMKVQDRIDAMEAALEVLAKSAPIQPPISKPGGQGLDNAPPLDLKPKTFLEQQQEQKYREKLRDRGSYASVAAKLYNKK